MSRTVHECPNRPSRRNTCANVGSSSRAIDLRLLVRPLLAHRQQSDDDATTATASDSIQSHTPYSPTPTPTPTPVMNDKASSAILFVILPLLSLCLPILLNLKLYAALSIAKRIYIYLIAASILIIGSARGSTDSPNLGERLQSLTAEILPGRDAILGLDDQEENGVSDDVGNDDRFEQLRALDAVTPTAQSAALPLIVGVSLALSVLLLQLRGGGLIFDLGGISNVMDSSQGFGAELLGPIVEALRSALPSLIQLSNVAVIGLFVRSEVGRGVKAWVGSGGVDISGGQDGAATPSGIAGDESRLLSPSQFVLPISATLVAVAYFAPPSVAWPARNLVCSCLGIGVVRAVQVPRLGPVVAALVLLVAYDVYSVGMMLVELGSQSLASGDASEATSRGVVIAAETAQQAAVVAPPASSAGAAAAAGSSSKAASSAMGAVAMSKVGGLGGEGVPSSLWQPGLLEVRLRGRVTDLLGLGDAVFPSLLSTFALRYDQNRADEGSSGRSLTPLYFAAAVTGYALGCVLCEFAPGIGSSGLPALLFIVPAMLTAALGLSAVRGELGEAFRFDPAGDEDENEK